MIPQFAELSDLLKHGAIPGLGGDGKSKPGKRLHVLGQVMFATFLNLQGHSFRNTGFC